MGDDTFRKFPPGIIVGGLGTALTSLGVPMKNLARLLIAATVFTVGSVLADTLELADGTLLEGDFVGSSNGIVMFNTGDGIEAFPEDRVVGIFLSSGVASAQAQAPA